MRKEILSVLAVGFLILSGFGAIAVTNEGMFSNATREKIETMEITKSITVLGKPEVVVDNGYALVTMQGANGYTMKPGEPVLPTCTVSLEIPSYAKDIHVVCTPRPSNSMEISSVVIPGPQSIIRDDDSDTDASLVKNERIYASADLYPNTWYAYSITFGRNSANNLVHFVDIVCNIVRYSPANNRLDYTNGMDITVTYHYNSLDVRSDGASQYDLVIIAPKRFEKILQPLVAHKNSLGMNTTLKTVESIVSEYSGRDAPEKIKYFIKYALDTWGSTYILLVGGLKSYINAQDREDLNQGTKDWWVPVRYTNIKLYQQYSMPSSLQEGGCPSDLYYADIYKEGKVFDDWDSNGNNTFAEAIADMGGYSDISDVLDLRPDVYVSRLACRNAFEVRIVINKIIKYEKTGPDAKPWFTRMITIAGKTHAIYKGIPDGEYVCNVSIGYMGDLVKPLHVYVSNNGTLGLRPTTRGIVLALNRGAGYVSFEGHGNPYRWDTIWADGTYPKDWAGGLKLFDFWKLFNGRRLPVVVIGGCHNGLFNVTTKQSSGPQNKSYWTHGIPIPESFCEGLLTVPWGGAIATIGGTGLGIGHTSGNPVVLSAELEANFFYQIGKAGATTFGQAHGGAISKYVTSYTVLDATDYHCITIYQPFGDPSLRLGGYS